MSEKKEFYKSEDVEYCPKCNEPIDHVDWEIDPDGCSEDGKNITIVLPNCSKCGCVIKKVYKVWVVNAFEQQ